MKDLNNCIVNESQEEHQLQVLREMFEFGITSFLFIVIIHRICIVYECVSKHFHLSILCKDHSCNEFFHSEFETDIFSLFNEKKKQKMKGVP